VHIVCHEVNADPSLAIDGSEESFDAASHNPSTHRCSRYF
jgi:hypothetical protein